MTRCEWANGELETAYHDREWGVPVHDDRVHFEFLLLEGAQAGLSWSTILRKRENYRRAFCGFDFERVARFSQRDQQILLGDPGIVRSRMKIASAVSNARAFLAVRDEFDTFDAYIWRFVDGKPLRGGWRSRDEVPATTALSDAMSKDLKKRGFSFTGSTICYSYMQAVGLVNDHVRTCFKYRS